MQSRTRQSGFQQVSKALLFSVISKFDAFQLKSSVMSAGRVAAPLTPAAQQHRVASVAAAAAQASSPHTAASRGDVASDAGSIGSEHVQQFYIVPRTGVFTTHTRLTTGLRLQRRPVALFLANSPNYA